MKLELFNKKSKNEENFFPTKQEVIKNDNKTEGANPFFRANEKGLYSAVLFDNDSITTVAKACSCCWDKKVPDEYKEKIEYISRRVKTGHTSILEHSNLIIGVYVPACFSNDLIDFLAYNRYLYTVTKKSYENPGSTYLIIGGSWRGYIDLFDNIPDMDNYILRRVRAELYTSVPKEIFYQVIKNDLMEEDSFPEYFVPTNQKIRIVFHDKAQDLYKYYTAFVDNEYISPVSIDDIFVIEYAINNFISEKSRPKNDYFNYNELGDFGTISICFKNMSRTATHQLVRHRNAITQESQRYVDYSNHSFVDPLKYSHEKYASDPRRHKYSIDGKFMTTEEIGKKLNSYYKTLVNDQQMPLHKEDARAFLGSNTACAKIYITFTYRTFAKFLELRTHISSQSEIRVYAKACEDFFKGFYDVDYHTFLHSRESILRSKNNCEESL